MNANEFATIIREKLQSFLDTNYGNEKDLEDWMAAFEDWIWLGEE